MEESYESFLDYLFIDVGGVMFIGAITMLVITGIGFFVVTAFIPQRSFKFRLLFSVYLRVIIQFSLVVQDYWGLKGFILMLIAMIVFGVPVRLIVKRRILGDNKI